MKWSGLILKCMNLSSDFVERKSCITIVPQKKTGVSLPLEVYAKDETRHDSSKTSALCKSCTYFLTYLLTEFSFMIHKTCSKSGKSHIIPKNDQTCRNLHLSMLYRVFSVSSARNIGEG